MNKNITNISYNWNNLPEHTLLAQDNQNTIDYLYDATGTKLRKVTSSDRATGLTTDYSGPFVYEDSKLAFIQTSEGRIVPDHDAYAYEYFLKDHLGNTRVVFNEQGEVLQGNSYYPFGGIMEGLNYTAGLAPENKHLYNGKEFQDDFGLDWYDYGARFYDAQLGRFHTLDPLNEKYYFQSSFAYGANNPIRFIDWMGMGPGDPPKNDETKPEINMFSPAVVEIAELYTTVKEKGKQKLNNAFNDVVSFIDKSTSSENTTVTSNAADIVENISKSKAVKEASQNMGVAIDLISISKDAANKDLSKSDEAADFTENTIQTVMQAAAGRLGPGVNLIIEDGKDPNGVTNTNNLRHSYRNSYRSSASHVYINFTLRSKQAKEKRKKNQSE